MKEFFYRFFVVVVAVSMTASGLQPALAQLGQSDLLPNLTPMRFGGPGTQRQIKAPDKQTLEDLFRKVELKTTNAPPIDLSTQKIPGLPDRAIPQLAINQFVVVNGTPYKMFSDVYAENRTEGKSNFVTVDSIVHPYFGFSNGVMASAIEEYIYKDLYLLLKGMLTSSIADYRRAEDDEVKDDIQRNLAFLCVGIRLLDPKAALPDIGGAIELVNADCAMIEAGAPGRSRIFNVIEDFGTFRPYGYMSQRPRLKRFYTAFQWLSRMQFPLSNTGNNTFEGGGNTFRRAVLLYRSLVLGNAGNESTLDKWSRIASGMAAVGYDSNAKRKTIMPTELEPVLKSSGSDFNRLLHSLSQPLTRTKLMLSVRNQRPLELNAKSVFEIGAGTGTAGDDVVFRFFPLTDPPELVWLREEGHVYKEPQEGPSKVPLGLLALHAHGAQQATNLLSDQLQSLDSGLSKRVPRLERLVRLLTPEDAAGDRHWGIISSIYRPYPDSVQVAIRSDLWLDRQLESAIAAWVDSYSALNMIPKGEATSTAPTQPPARPIAPQPSRPAAVKPARFHYLEPRIEVYKNLQLDIQYLVKQLTDLGYMPQQYLQRSQDFTRLFKRLTVISDLEIKNEPVSISDFNLLASIDRVLQPVDCPLSSYIFLDISKDLTAEKAQVKALDDPDVLASKQVSTATRAGATIGIGRPGKLFIICSTSQGPMLTRGACYTYYEIQGGPTKDEHWERKLTYGLLLPPYWTRKFNVTPDENKSKNVQITQD